MSNLFRINNSFVISENFTTKKGTGIECSGHNECETNLCLEMVSGGDSGKKLCVYRKENVKCFQTNEDTTTNPSQQYPGHCNKCQVDHKRAGKISGYSGDHAQVCVPDATEASKVDEVVTQQLEEHATANPVTSAADADDTTPADPTASNTTSCPTETDLCTNDKYKTIQEYNDKESDCAPEKTEADLCTNDKYKTIQEYNDKESPEKTEADLCTNDKYKTIQEYNNKKTDCSESGKSVPLLQNWLFWTSVGLALILIIMLVVFFMGGKDDTNVLF